MGWLMLNLVGEHFNIVAIKTMSREDFVLICELNPKYDGDSLPTRIDRVERMLTYSQMNRWQRRALGVISPFDGIDVRHIEAGARA